jgi:anti-sigma factor ChrR (cupin superfamily)
MAERGHRDIFEKDIEWLWTKGANDGIETQYTRYLMDEEDPSSPLVLLVKFGPNKLVMPHTHGTNYFEYVVSGGQTVGKISFGPGDIRFAKAGTGYGPIKVGPQGCTVLIIFQDATGSSMIPLGRAKKLAEESAS